MIMSARGLRFSTPPKRMPTGLPLGDAKVAAVEDFDGLEALRRAVRSGDDLQGGS